MTTTQPGMQLNDTVELEAKKDERAKSEIARAWEDRRMEVGEASGKKGSPQRNEGYRLRSHSSLREARHTGRAGNF
jgi:hypothetical protein